MDILAIALGATPGATSETASQVDLGFAQALGEAAPPPGPTPKGVPPGDPPPILENSGEGVKSTEPNAHSRELDFLPNEKIELDLPTPFWQSANTDSLENFDGKDLVKDSGSKAEAVDPQVAILIASQLPVGFFATPLAVVQTPCAQDLKVGDRPIPLAGNKAPAVALEVPIGIPPTPLPAATSSNPDLKLVTGKDPIFLEIDSADAQKGRQTEVELDAPSSYRILDRTESEYLKPVLELHDSTDDLAEVAETSQQVQSSPIVQGPADKAGLAGEMDGLLRKDGFGVNQTGPTEVSDDRKQNQVGPTGEVARISSLKESRKSRSDELAESPDNSFGKTQSAHDRGGDKQGLESNRQSTPQTPSSTQARNSEQDFELDSNQPLKARLEVAVDPSEGAEEGMATVIRQPQASSSTIVDTKPTLTPVETSDVVRQVADRMRLLAAARPKEGVTIHLNPDDLGSITVVVKSIGHLVDAQITATDDRVRNALDQNQTRLVEALDRHGYRLQAVNVGQQATDSTANRKSSLDWSHQSSSQNRSHQDGSAQSRGQNNSYHGGEQAPKTRMSIWNRFQTGVDLTI
jgi:flagellar hook-length control protein FliK